MFVFFLSLGRYVEMVARHRAGSVADALARLAPVTARRIRGEQVEDVQAIELQPGDEILVRTGEVFAADGTVAERCRRTRRRIDADRRIDARSQRRAAATCTPARRTSVHRCACA